MCLDFTDIVLLIGTNPLPNYVAAKYFIVNNSNLRQIWMVCSEEQNQRNQKSTQEYAETLKGILKCAKIEFPELIFISDIGSRSSIEQALDRILENTGNNKVHLSFTGGTKAMSTYSYSYLQKKGEGFSASYLSARSFKMKFDDGTISDNLVNRIKISFDNLLKLHLFKKVEEKSDKYKGLGSVTKEFEELIKRGKICNFYADCGYEKKIFEIKGNKDIEKIFKNMHNIIDASNDKKILELKLSELKSDKEKSNFKRRVNILKKIKEYKPNDEFLSIINAFTKEYRIYTNGCFNKDIEIEKYRTAIEFMDGFWLEQYVGRLIEDKLKDKFDEIKVNQKPYREKESNHFELDIVLMKGYQLTGISCTTSGKKSLCKEKGFEIILRTRQIGGEEAKAILITRADEKTVKTLQSELLLDAGTNKKNIIVLGIDDWAENKLTKKIGGYL